MKDKRKLDVLYRCMKEQNYRLVEGQEFYRKYFGPDLTTRVAAPMNGIAQPKK